MLDGFVELGREDLTGGAELNIEQFRNEISPFARVVPDLRPETATVLIDTFYGQCFDEWINDGSAVYGETADLPEFSGDSLANYSFLRVPYRRIPRIRIQKQSELMELVGRIESADPDLRLFFRGQNREHLLQRDAATLRVLYGDGAALEPSLLTSASRRGIDLEAVLPEWSNLLQIYMATQRKYLDVAELEALKTSPRLLAFALAIAQHYGLPSAGIDVTDRLDIALFFALSVFDPVPGETSISSWRRLSGGADPPVIYLFTSTERFELDYRLLAPKGLRTPRPDRQSAHFLQTGWGLKRNGCARQLFLALYLDPDGDFGEILNPSALFPLDDEIGAFLETSVQKNVSSALRDLLGSFRWVVGP